MKRYSFVVVILALVGCKTPNRYVPPEAGVEEDGSLPGTPDAPLGKVDGPVSVASDGPLAAGVDTASSGGDTQGGGPAEVGAPMDMAPPPCTSGTARCAPSGTAVETCSNGQWTTKENCPLTCSGAVCTAVCMAGVPCTQGIGACRKGATTCATPSSPPACADVGADDSRGGCTGGNICKGGACVAACQGGVACTQGIAACRKGATFCATPASEPVCNESGVDDTRGGCTGGNVCKGGDCVAPCQGGVACTQGIGPCRKGATFCATPTSTPACNDSGVDDSKGGCGGGQICKNGACAQDPCAPKSAANLVPNGGFDTTIWPKFGSEENNREWSPSDALGCSTSGSLRIGDAFSSSRICIPVQPSTTYHLGYMVNRTSSAGTAACGINEWYDDTACANSLDFGQTGNSPAQTGWQQVSGTVTSIAGARSGILVCFIVSTQSAYFDRVFLRATPGGF